MIMETLEQIQNAYKAATGYPDLVKKLVALGVQSYTVEVASDIVLYRFAEGKTALLQKTHPPKAIAENFDRDLTIKAVRDTQQGKTGYPTFMNDIAKAGVRFYEATLSGENKRVTYIGVGGYYEEKIPV
jgi:uncharacterized protein YbcV (DUF1398 family)